MIRYSASTGGFYPYDIHYPNLPADCVEITEDEHAALMAAQATGQQIVADANGMPVAVDPPPPPIIIPALVSKLALVKAMREMGPDGLPATGASIWDAVKAAIAAAGGDVAEDWQLANYIPRHDPMINALAAQLVPTDPPREAMLDALFLRAAQLE